MYVERRDSTAQLSRVVLCDENKQLEASEKTCQAELKFLAADTSMANGR